MLVRGKRGRWAGWVNRCLKRFHSPTGTRARVCLCERVCVCINTQQSIVNETTISLLHTRAHTLHGMASSQKEEVELESSIQQLACDSTRGLTITQCNLGWNDGFVFLNLKYKTDSACLWVRPEGWHQIKPLQLIKGEGCRLCTYFLPSHTTTVCYCWLCWTVPFG